MKYGNVLRSPYLEKKCQKAIRMLSISIIGIYLHLFLTSLTLLKIRENMHTIYQYINSLVWLLNSVRWLESTRLWFGPSFWDMNLKCIAAVAVWSKWCGKIHKVRSLFDVATIWITFVYHWEHVMYNDILHSTVYSNFSFSQHYWICFHMTKQYL